MIARNLDIYNPKRQITYAEVLDNIERLFPTRETNIGNPITVYDSADYQNTGILISGKTINGDNVSGNIIIKTSNRNVFDVNGSITYRGSARETIENKELIVTDTGNSSGNHYVQYQLLKKIDGLQGKKIRFGAIWNNSSINKGALILRIGGNAVAYRTSSGSYSTYTIPVDADGSNGLQLSVYSNYQGTVSRNDFVKYSDIIVTINDDDMNYVDHKSQTINFPLEEGQVLEEEAYLADDGIHHLNSIVDSYTTIQKIAWKKIKNLQMYKGTTHIFAESDGLRPDLKVAYIQDLDYRLTQIEQAILSSGENI